jgi:hypothetical protein
VVTKGCLKVTLRVYLQPTTLVVEATEVAWAVLATEAPLATQVADAALAAWTTLVALATEEI